METQKVKLEVLVAQHDVARASLDEARQNYQLTRLDLEDTVVRAPVDGVVGNRKVQVGRYLNAGTNILSIVPLDKVWVVANFKETQLADLKVGQVVSISVDGYSGQKLSGRIDSLAPGSGAAFSLMPPDNATGNFVRVVQRVPVKITLTDHNLSDRLVPGLSLRVQVALGSEGGQIANGLARSASQNGRQNVAAN